MLTLFTEQNCAVENGITAIKTLLNIETEFNNNNCYLAIPYHPDY